MTQVCKRTMRNAWRLSSRLVPFLVVSGLALLLVVGCGGAKGTMPTAPSDQSSLVSRQANNLPSTPMIFFPWNGWIVVGGQVSFFVRATDLDGDRLKYRIELLQGGNVVLVFDQTQSTNGWSKPVYNSGEWAWLLASVPRGTYQWRVKAYDGKDWGPFSNNHTFTAN